MRLRQAFDVLLNEGQGVFIVHLDIVCPCCNPLNLIDQVPFVESAVQLIFPGVYNIYWLWVVVKILLVPLICGAGYELLKFAGRHDNILTKIISAPGIALQHLTVYEPDDDMIEVAIAAVQKVIPEDGSDRIR